MGTQTGTQSEAQLEASLLARLQSLGWAPASLPDEAALLANLRAELGAHNGTTFSEAEFAVLLNHLAKGGVLDKARRLRDRFKLARDDGTSLWVEFFNAAEWCRNRFQVASQIGIEGRRRNRYDVTLLVNGLPLAQIELKRRGVELKQAFNQINRYQRDSFRAAHGLFQYVQAFVISNGVNTRLYANNRHQTFRQTFAWADEANRPLNRLEAFADAVLERCALAKLVARYVVIHDTDGVLMLLRSYQVQAVEAITRQVERSREGGYVWHATGSGKTLTSFKAAQTLLAIPKVTKVVFVVDRADLDYQTIQEFNKFERGSVDATADTRALVRQMGDPDARLVVTTIQKLNAALAKDRHAAAMERIRGDRIVFIFDECHRSQFGEGHARIRAHFAQAQMFGFTGTPILAANAVGRRTTRDLFGACLHRYIITDAIRDGNVLPFSVEYWGPAEGWAPDQSSRELHEHPDVVARKVGWVIENHGRKTRDRQFGAMMAMGSVDGLLAVWDEFERRREAGEHDLAVAAIFTYAANEEDPDADGLLPDPEFPGDAVPPAAEPKRDRLQAIVEAYNARYGTNETALTGDGFYAYYRGIAKRVKARDRKPFDPAEGIDVLLVVGMFLTGFDAKTLNTLYVDKPLRHHGLIQAFSRTNRVLGSEKSQGNVVCFRDLKERTDDAIALFGDRDARETVLVPPYAAQLARYEEAVAALRAVAPDANAVDALPDEDAQAEFAKAFREVLRIRNVLASHSEFAPANLPLPEQDFEDYKSKYLDLEQRRSGGADDAPAGPLDAIDFELELLRRDEINVAYILALIATLRVAETEGGPAGERRARATRKRILDLLNGEEQLRTKRPVIEAFLNERLPSLPPEADVRAAFAEYWSEARAQAYARMCAEEGADPVQLETVMRRMLFTGREPSSSEVVDAMAAKPGILARKGAVARILAAVRRFVGIYDEGVGEIEET